MSGQFVTRDTWECEVNWRNRVVGVVAANISVAVVLGLAAGALWQAVAPRPTMVAYSGGVGYARVADSGIAMDLSLGLILAVCGGVCALIGLAAFAGMPRVSLVTVWVGGVVGSLIAWKFAELIAGGPHAITSELAAGLAEGTQFTGPLVLNTYGVLGLWSLVAAIVLAVGFALRTRRMRRSYAQLWARTYPDSAAQPTDDAPVTQIR